MNIDKSWIARPRNTIEYLDGLEVFLNFAFANGCIRDTIKCPCPNCGFRKWQKRDVVRDHLICKPFPRTYEIWTFHGEKTIAQPTRNINIVQDEVHSNNPMEMIINNAFGLSNQHTLGFDASQLPVDIDITLNDRSKEDFGDFYDESNASHRGITCSTSIGKSRYARNEDKLAHLESQLNGLLNALKTYILRKEGSIPDELASVFNLPSEPTMTLSEVGWSSSASNQDQTQNPH